jgi:hypothetical protein
MKPFAGKKPAFLALRTGDRGTNGANPGLPARPRGILSGVARTETAAIPPPTPDLMSAVASDAVLAQAFDWLCRQRHDYAPHQDVWDVRWRWHDLKPRLQQQLLRGTYRLGPVQRFGDGDDAREVWAALDALVLKAVALVLAGHWAFSPRCHHVAGHGGAKAAVRAVDQALPDCPFVLRSDVQSYYASLDHELVLAQLRDAIPDQRLLTLLEKYVRRTVYQDGLYRDVTRGISLGCPLSPLIAALYLKPLDQRLEATGLFYARFMDDWVVLAPTRWTLRRAARVMQQTLAELKVATHPDKTFLGRTARGFDFLGYRFGAAGLTGVAEATVARFAEKAGRLAAQDEPGDPPTGQRLGRDRPGDPSAVVERVVAGGRPAAGPGEGAPPWGENATAAAPQEPGAPGRGANGPAYVRAPRLYEQAAPASPRRPGGLAGLAGRCGDYVRRWCRWVTSGLSCTRWAQTLRHGGDGPGGRRATHPTP